MVACFQQRVREIENRRMIPHKPIVFHGREDSLKTVAGILRNGPNPRVYILGSGGMGKTVLAAAVIQSNNVQASFLGSLYPSYVKWLVFRPPVQILSNQSIKWKCSRRYPL